MRSRVWMRAAALFAVVFGCGTPRVPTEPGSPPAQHTIAATNFQFTPAQLTIRAGDLVTWVNQGGFHNVVADDGSFRCASDCAGPGGGGDPTSAAWSFTRTFAAPGRAAFFCEVHGGSGGRGMSGVITVEAAVGR